MPSTQDDSVEPAPRNDGVPAPILDTAQVVRRLRRTMRLTQQQLAGRLGVTPLTVHRWENGQSRPHPLAAAQLRTLEEESAAVAARGSEPPLVTAPGRPAIAPVLDFAGGSDAVLAVAEALHLAYGHQCNPAFASETARIDPLPHQRIAVYERMLRQDPLRFLLADDAGAGKTIMTGLVVREMLSRGRIGRVIVVPPAGLVGNWERELRTLFGLRFHIVTGADARARNPFRGPDGDLIIVSLDTLAGDTVFDRLRSAGVAPYDLAVFDEAHKLSAAREGRRTRKSRRYRLAEALAGCAAAEGRIAGLDWSARHLLLLTATPHMGKDSPYHHLWRLLDPHVLGAEEAFRRFPAAARARHFIRRTKEEMVDLAGRPLYPQRTCATFGYDLTSGTDGEQALYDLTSAWLRRSYGRALDNRPAARLALSVFQRRLASSTWALRRSLERRAAKLRRTVDDLAAGRLTAADLRSGHLPLGDADDTDVFDALDDADTGGDETAAGRAAAYEEAVLGALVAVNIDELHEEIAAIDGLITRADRLIEAGAESKFERLREVLDDPRYAGDKWLIFSEHRDTVEYLIRRLEGLGHAERIVSIHGGMAWTEREAAIERFRSPDGARFLVATDAAGEGINLQFCRLMVNYDIPWNPARLEQRLGRIHRYGQRRDVVIVNLVATSTREGRVLRVLLDKLDAIGAELRSDKVFDVIGRLIDDRSLGDYLLETLTDEGERRVRDRLDAALTTEQLGRVEAADARIYGPPGEVAERLDALRGDLDRERYLHLLPAYVRRFVETAARLLGLTVQGDLNDDFTLAPGRPAALDPLLPALDGYPPAARDHLRVRRPSTGAPCIWLHPGEPVFDALRDHVLQVFGRDALRGAILTDPRGEAPYLMHLAEVSITERREESDAGSADGSHSHGGTAEGPASRERRLLALRQKESGAPAECSVEELLLLRPAPGAAPGAVPLAGRALGLRAEATAHAGRLVERIVEEQRAARRTELPDRRRRVAANFECRAADLAARRTALGSPRADGDGKEELEAVKRAQRAIRAERQRALARVERAPDRIERGGIRFLAHALVIPAGGDDDDAGAHERAEEIAVRIAIGWEQDLGARVQDISRPALARAAGLPDWPGFDLLAHAATGERRCIEVKGRAGRTAIQMELNEWRQAFHLGDQYWLYVVFDCATPAPTLVRVQNPFDKLLAKHRASSMFTIAAAALMKVMERS